MEIEQAMGLLSWSVILGTSLAVVIFFLWLLYEGAKELTDKFDKNE